MDNAVAIKIKKLLALAEDGASPEEAASAFAKAQDLMTRYKITQATIQDITLDNEEPIQDFYDSPLNEEDAGKRKTAAWKWSLADSLAKHNGCSLFASRAKIIIVGKPSDVNCVRYLYEFCYRKIDQLTKQYCKGYGRTYANNFRLGCVDAIEAALEAERDKLKQELLAANNERALVVLDKVLVTRQQAKDFATDKYKLRKRSGHTYRGSDAARQSGYAAGQGIYTGEKIRSTTTRTKENYNVV
jgi:hypothetical protein